MAHFAKIGDDNIVKQVIVIGNDDIVDENGEEQEELGIAFINNLYKTDENWIQTSYNTRGGVHYSVNESGVYEQDDGVALRKNYAGLGYTYDEERDAFIPPKPFDSWSLDEDTCIWEAPTPSPEDGESYFWDEDTLNWIKE